MVKAIGVVTSSSSGRTTGVMDGSCRDTVPSAGIVRIRFDGFMGQPTSQPGNPGTPTVELEVSQARWRVKPALAQGLVFP